MMRSGRARFFIIPGFPHLSIHFSTIPLKHVVKIRWSGSSPGEKYDPGFLESGQDCGVPV